jgi:GT2 family glycosyltransferase
MYISVVMTNWNGKEILSQTLPTVLDAVHYDTDNYYEVLLIDDCSADGSAEYVRQSFPEVTVCGTPRNLGSIEAANFGVSKAMHPFILLLNSDMKLSKDAPAVLARHMEKEDVFAVTPAVYDWSNAFLYGNRGGYFRFGHFSQFEKPENDTSTQTLFACGGAFLFRKKIFQELGGYDSALYHPYYYEEIDISYRALKRGCRIIYEPQARVFHKIQGSISKDSRYREIRYISGRNNYLFTWKNITDTGKVFSMLFFIPLFLLRDLFRGKFRFWVCFFRALRHLPRALRKRSLEKKLFKHTDTEVLGSVNGKK